MGHIVNPVGTHVGISYSWRYKWLLKRGCDYKYMVDLQNFFHNFFVTFFNNLLFKENGVLYVFHKFVFSRGANSILVYIQDSFFSSALHQAFSEVCKKTIKQFLKDAYLRKAKVLLPGLRAKKDAYLWTPRYSDLGAETNIEILMDEEGPFFAEHFEEVKLALNDYFCHCFFWLFVKKLAIGFMSTFFNTFCRSSSFFIFVLSNTSQSSLFFNSTLVARYFIRKFQHRHLLKNIAPPVIRYLTKSQLVTGFKVTFSGRFSRAERATYQWMKRGKVSLNKFTDIVDYDYDFTSLKFGCVCVKVWISFSHVNSSIELTKKSTYGVSTF
jgi:hypothetical protein